MAQTQAPAQASPHFYDLAHNQLGVPLWDDVLRCYTHRSGGVKKPNSNILVKNVVWTMP